MVGLTLLSLTILGQTVLSGHDLSVAQAEAKAELIVVANLTPSGLIFGSGPSWWMSVDLKPFSMLKGMAKPSEFLQVGLTGSGPEVQTKIGQEYVIFLAKLQGHYSTIKLIEKTPENMLAVREAIKKPIVFTGSRLTVEEAQERAELIVVAELTRFHDVLGSGLVMISSIDLKPSVFLKGQSGVKEWKEVGITAGSPEVLPPIGQEYIVFLEKFKGHHSTTKIMMKTSDNLELVQKAIDEKSRP